MNHVRTLPLCLAALLMLTPAHALIRPDFTPAHLVAICNQVLDVEVTGADAKVRVVGALKGATPAALALEPDDDAAAALREIAPQPTPGLLFSAKDFSAAGTVNAAERPIGALHVAGAWFSLYAKPGGFAIRQDALDLRSVWAGSTVMLRRGVLSVLADPLRAEFPVRVGVQWRGESAIGQIDGGVTGLQAVELVPGQPPFLLVQSAGGDRLYEYRHGAFADVTGARGMGSRSLRAAWTDLDADGCLDLVSWDGTAVSAWLQGADGRVAARAPAWPLPTCTSIVAVRGGVACGVDGGALVLMPRADGPTATRLALAPDARAPLGAAGPLVAADLDADGRTDLAQAYEQGLVAWPGTAEGFADARVVLRAKLGRDITAADVGDLDSDGLVEIILAGRYGGSDAAGVNILANHGGFTFLPAWHEAGEVYKVQTRARACQVCDINADGRPDLMLGYERASPIFLFSRGFRTFGTADELALGGALVGDGEDAKALACGDAFNGGAPHGVVADFDGDGAQDAAFATAAGDTWVVWRERGPACLALVLATPPAWGPVRVMVTEGKTPRGALIARPGRPAYLGVADKGLVHLQWYGADGAPRTKDVRAVGTVTRVTLSD